MLVLIAPAVEERYYLNVHVRNLHFTTTTSLKMCYVCQYCYVRHAKCVKNIANCPGVTMTANQHTPCYPPSNGPLAVGYADTTDCTKLTTKPLKKKKSGSK